MSIRAIVGEVATFNVAVRNTGTSAAANVVLRVQFDPAIEPVIENGVTRLDDGSVAVQLDRELAANEKRRDSVCKADAGIRARMHARERPSRRLGGADSQDEACLEILPANAGLAARRRWRRRDRLE